MRFLRKKGKTIGFVPTMGALHEGHLSLVRRAKRENDVTAVSIFVNPLQFGPKEDFTKYPRVLEKDRRLLKKIKADYLFAPEFSGMYPCHSRIILQRSSPSAQQPFRVGGENPIGSPTKAFGDDRTIVEPAPELVRTLCALFRPGHFRGVTTVVAKLLNIVEPDKVYFGAKDYQQAIILKRMIHDLNFGCEFRLVPTVREKDGLAMSSRNAYLNMKERLRAMAVSQTLFWARDRLLAGEKNLARIKKEAIKLLMDSNRGQAITHCLSPVEDKVQYFEIVDPENLSVLKHPQAKMVAVVACFVGKTRLIDNVIIDKIQKEHS